MATSQPLAALSMARKTHQCHLPLSQGLSPSSSSTRVLILIDVGSLCQPKDHGKGANRSAAAAAATATTAFVDGVRLSVLRVLSQLSLACPTDSRVEWAARFFDSRHSGIGKTPTELKARLRSRQAGAQGSRGFKSLNQASFQAFGQACLAVACGVQGDPFVRDQQAALKRWSRGRQRQQQPQNRVAHKAAPAADARNGFAERGAACDALGGRSGADSWPDEAIDDGPKQMYAGHDMSSHEVLVRSLLEALQEFGEANEGERTDSQRLLLVHTHCPETEEGVKRFALEGNFATLAATIATQCPEEQAPAMLKVLDAGIGKAVRHGRSLGVTFRWQDSAPSGNTQSRRHAAYCVLQRTTSLDRCLSATGSADVLRWRRTIESTGLLPPSATLGKFHAARVDGKSALDGDKILEQGEPPQGIGQAVAVALGGQGLADTRLVASSLSYGAFRERQPASMGEEELAPALQTTSALRPVALRSTPWRLMGTLPLSEVWPAVLVDQEWGATVVLRAERGKGALRWGALLRYLLAGGLAASITLPRHLFQVGRRAGEEDAGVREKSSDALTVALLMPVNEECAVGWSIAGGEMQQDAGMQSSGRRTLSLLDEAQSHGEGAAAAGATLPSLLVGSLSERTDESERTLNMRQAQVRSALEESTLARKRRRHAKTLPAQRSRGPGSINSSSAARGSLGRGTPSGGVSGSMSPRESVSLSFAEEDDAERANSSRFRKWQMEIDSEASHASGSPRSFRLPETAMGVGEEDEVASSAGSSMGPRRALHQALEDASSRSSLFSRDADSSSTPSSKEGSGSSGGGSTSRRLENEGRFSRRRGRGIDGLFPTTEVPVDTRQGSVNPEEPIDGGARELPLPFMSEPRLACLPSAPLPTEICTLAERCALENEAAASSRSAAVDADESFKQVKSAVSTPTASQGFRKARANRLFIAAVRAAKQMERENDGGKLPAAPTAKSVCLQPWRDRPLQTVEERQYVEAAGNSSGRPAFELHSITATEEENECCQGKVTDVPAVTALGHEDFVSTGVAGLHRQYLEVMEGGQRSPVDYVVRTVPEAIRDMANACIADDRNTTTAVETTRQDKHAKASALVLAAVVNGLTSSPEELGAKHKANRGAKSASGIPGQAGRAIWETGRSVASPAIQKIRDFQLQAMLLCQLNTLAMDMSDTSEATNAFAALATSGARGVENPSDVGKKKGKGKKKKQKRQGGAGTDEDIDPIRPSDPLPNARRSRLESFLQPISTMLDACNMTKAVAPANTNGAESGNSNGSSTSASSARAYDGTLADFMGLALVEHFASSLPRTLMALFEDFERHPPDRLVAALDSGGGASINGEIANIRTGGTGERACEDESASKGVAPGAGLVEAVLSDVNAGDAAEADSRTSATAGILLSDRTSMSHHHFKMSGVLNGFREVKLKAQASTRGLNSGAPGGRGSVNKQSRRSESSSKSSAQGGSWRRSATGGGGGGNTRPRAGRDSKNSGLVKAVPAVPRPTLGNDVQRIEVRHSPRLSRKRPEGTIANRDGASADSGVSDPSSSRKKRPISSSSTALSSDPPRKRRQMSPSTVSSLPKTQRPNEAVCAVGVSSRTVAPRTRSGILVGETPRKRSGAVGAASRTSRRNITIDTEARVREQNGKPASPPSQAAGPGCPGSPAARKARTKHARPPRSSEEDKPGTAAKNIPSTVVASPAEGRTTRRQRLMDATPAPDSEASELARAIMPSPPSWRAASAASRLFVEESPGIAAAGTNTRTGRSRSEWASSVESGAGGGISRQLVTETASPITRRQTVVPDTPVC